MVYKLWIFSFCFVSLIFVLYKIILDIFISSIVKFGNIRIVDIKLFVIIISFVKEKFLKKLFINWLC